MSSVLIHPTHQGLDSSECARLIPGEAPVPRLLFRKPAQSVRRAVAGNTEPERAGVAGSPLSFVGLLVPHPLRSRTAPASLRSICTDVSLIAINWLFIGVLLRPLHEISPVVPVFEFCLRSSVFLLGVSLLHAALITLVGYTEGLYRVGTGSRERARCISRSVLLGSLVLCSAYSLQGSHWSIVGLVGVASVLHFGSMRLWRWWNTEGESLGGIAIRNVLIIGAGRVGRRVAAYIEGHPGCGRSVCGFLDDNGPLGSDVIGRVSDLALLARKGFVDEVILAAPHDGRLAERVLREARRLKLDVEIVPELFGCDPAEQEIEDLGGLPVICVHAERLPSAGLVAKRVIDIVGASLGLILISPVLVAIALLIKLDSKGPALYVGRRAGAKGRSFRCYKFRTMVRDAHQQKHTLRKRNERSGPIFKISDDPRITRVGGFLRRYSLDELPQLWNVVRGEMSLVGPRPHPVEEFAAYDVGHLARLDITPGLTGLWQVSARRDPSFDRAMELDREYIRTWSLGLDLRILLKTVLAVAQGSGS
ncbi:MAG TPA: sugar transferase [Candidatus Binatia bacterium]|nr:sugar transferase [Candidatus Binatia bacterium]